MECAVECKCLYSIVLKHSLIVCLELNQDADVSYAVNIVYSIFVVCNIKNLEACKSHVLLDYSDSLGNQCGELRCNSGGSGCDDLVCQLVAKSNELLVPGYKVCLAVELQDNSLVALDLCKDFSLFGSSCAPLCSCGKTFLLKNLYSLFNIAFCLDESFLAVAHSGTCLLSKVFYINWFYFH